MVAEGGRQAEISLTDSSDNMRVGIIAQKLITPRVLQALDPVFIYLYPLRPQHPPQTSK